MLQVNIVAEEVAARREGADALAQPNTPVSVNPVTGQVLNVNDVFLGETALPDAELSAFSGKSNANNRNTEESDPGSRHGVNDVY